MNALCKLNISMTRGRRSLTNMLICKSQVITCALQQMFFFFVLYFRISWLYERYKLEKTDMHRTSHDDLFKGYLEILGLVHTVKLCEAGFRKLFMCFYLK